MKNSTSLPFVSVIIPVFNEEKYIHDCLSSVLALDWPQDRMEIIVVDNGSTDKSKEIAGALLEKEGRGRVVLKLGGTIASVRNFGWRHAKGDILAFLDGDSVVEVNWLEKGVTILQSDPNVSCVGFAASPPLPSDSWVDRTWFHISSSGKKRETDSTSWLSSFNLILREDMFSQIGGFDENLITCEDVDLGMKLSACSRLVLSKASQVRHLGNAKTVVAFVEKEIWRGQNNLQVWLKSEDKRKGSLSVFVPLIYTFIAVFLMLFCIASMASWINWGTCIFLLIVFFAIPILLSVRAGVFEPYKLISASILYCIYLLSRGVAIVRYHFK